MSEWMLKASSLQYSNGMGYHSKTIAMADLISYSQQWIAIEKHLALTILTSNANHQQKTLPVCSVAWKCL